MFEIITIMEYNYYFTVRITMAISKIIIEMRFIKVKMLRFIKVVFVIITIIVSSLTFTIISMDYCYFEDRCFDSVITLEDSQIVIMVVFIIRINFIITIIAKQSFISRIEQLHPIIMFIHKKCSTGYEFVCYRFIIYLFLYYLNSFI
jgi:hypothetical protein